MVRLSDIWAAVVENQTAYEQAIAKMKTPAIRREARVQLNVYLELLREQRRQLDLEAV